MNKLLLVDLDDTLCNSSVAYQKAQEACFSFLKKHIPRLSKKKFNELYQESRKYVHKNLKGTASSHNRLLYFQRMLEILEFPSDPEFLQDNLADIYWQTTYKNLKLFPGVRETLQKIYDSKVEMGLVSNLLTDIQIKKMETLKIAKYFDFCFSVSKRLKLSEPYIVTEEIKKSNGRSYKNPKIREIYTDDKKIKCFEMTSEKDMYKGYTPIRGIEAENEEELQIKIEKLCKCVIDKINEPLIECPHCKGRGVIIDEDTVKIEVNKI